MAVTICYFTSVLLETFLLCKPVQYNWDKSIAGSCDGQNTAYLVAGITNLVIDVFVVALPMPMLFGLRMSLPKRLGVIGMFSLGAFICIVSLLRILWLLNWDLNDMTYTVVPGTIYTVLEPTLGIVNACLPTIKPALARLAPAGACAGIRDRLTARSGTSGKHAGGNQGHGSSGGGGGGGSRLADSGRDRSRSTIKGLYTRQFERLESDDAITLVGMQQHSAVSHPESVDGADAADGPHEPNASGITVSREWQVQNM